MEYHHYDQNGKCIGSSDDGQGIDPNILAPLFALGFLVVGLFWLWELVAGWKSYPVPINYLAGYYYYILLVPLKFVGDIWSWNVVNQITDYSNLNLIIGVALEVVYASTVLHFFRQIFSKSGRLNFLSRTVLLMYFGPAFVLLVLFVVGGILSWLFK